MFDAHGPRRGAILMACLLSGFAGAVDAVAPPDCTPAPFSNLGCDFYAVSLPNPLLDQATFAFGVDLLNATSSQGDVAVTGGSLVTPANYSIAAGANNVATLPWVAAISMTDSTIKIAGAAYHIVTSAPVTAVQLNPTAAHAGMTDASLAEGLVLPRPNRTPTNSTTQQHHNRRIARNAWQASPRS